MTGNQDLLLRLRAAKPDQPGWWMVERDDQKVRPLYLTGCGGAAGWTQDWREGFKFAERENAEQQVELWHSDYGHVRSHGMMAEFYNPDGPEAADRIEKLEALLRSAFDAIKTLDEDALGYAGDPRSEQPWPIRDELLRNIDLAVPRATLSDNRGVTK